MSPDQIDTAIAEFRGWTEISRTTSLRLYGIRPDSEGEKYRLAAVPQYHRCLNAMAEARKGLTEDQQADFIHILNCNHQTADIYSPDENTRRYRRELATEAFGLVDATATEQARAILEVIGKWQKLQTHITV